MMCDWRDPAQHKPTAMDADVQGCVLVWHKYNGCMLMNWHIVLNNPYIQAWMPTPKRPDWC